MLHKEDFLPLVGCTVEVVNEGQRVPVEIIEATSIASPSPRPAPFRVIFRSAASWRGQQGIYALNHPELGALELFAVPIGPDGQGLCYEVIFN